MKEDYLWDRTGSDAEIEGLESMLAGLAFHPTEPPELPVRQIVLAPARTNWLFRLGLGFAAASLVIAALLIATVITRQGDRPAVAAVKDETPTPVATVPPVSETDVEYQKISAPPQRRSKPKKRGRRVAKILPAPRPLPVITLTAEEADAYRQLMTALSITGRNLNIVRDKINGSED